MGLSAKSSIPLMRVSAYPALEQYLNDFGTGMLVVGPKEVQQLSRFFPVLVLLPASSSDSEGIRPAMVGDKVLGDGTAAAKVLKFLSNALTPSTTRNGESDAAFGDVKINFSCMEASREGKRVTLTALEFKTLKYMIQNARRVISRDELLNEVWGYENYPCTRTVDNHILRLRRKLERNPSRPLHFHTVHGAGYKFLP